MDLQSMLRQAARPNVSNPGFTPTPQLPYSYTPPQGKKSGGTPETQANSGNVYGLSTTRGGGSGSGSTEDMQYLDYSEGLLRDQLARAKTSLGQGLTNLSDSYNREVSSANQQRSRALENYGLQREDTTRAKQEALGKVDTNARTLNDSLRRILGMAAGSGSSAYQFAAPNAVAREASGERTDVLSDYGANFRDLDLAETRAKEDFATLLDDLARQRNTTEQELRTGILTTEQGINAQLADIAAKKVAARGGGTSAQLAATQPYQGAINDRNSQIDALFERFRSPQLNVKPVEVQTPDMRQYTVDKAAINAGNQAGDTSMQYSPYAYFLRRNDEQVA